MTLLPVKLLSGRTLMLDVDGMDTVATLKQLIEAEEGTPRAYQRLIFAGMLLEDDRALDDYNVLNKSSTLHMIVRLPAAEAGATTTGSN